MKRRFLILFSLICTLTVFASCSIPYEKPYGKWRNETLGLTLDIEPSRVGHDSGIYVKNGEEVEVMIIFDHSKAFFIQDIIGISTSNYRYFYGSFNVNKNGELHYKLHSYWQELHGIKDTIIFKKVEEYAND